MAYTKSAFGLIWTFHSLLRSRRCMRRILKLKRVIEVAPSCVIRL